ncbi:MAG: Kae1-associated kinase Bud32 [Candidatus Caldarchaeum sp.]
MLELIDFVEGRVIRVGAEAVVREAFWKDVKLVKKHRLPKRYRQESIDARVRRNRTVHEAKTLTYLSENGVPAPLLLFLDLKQSAIYMQMIEGVELRFVSNPLDRAVRLGEIVGLMHSLNIAHGDLTLSNIIVDRSDGLWLVDFGLSVFNAELEEKAVDIHLLERSAASTFPNLSSSFVKLFLDGYRSVTGEGQVEKILKKVSEIRRRGRYVVKS